MRCDRVPDGLKLAGKELERVCMAVFEDEASCEGGGFVSGWVRLLAWGWRAEWRKVKAVVFEGSDAGCGALRRHLGRAQRAVLTPPMLAVGTVGFQVLAQERALAPATSPIPPDDEIWHCGIDGPR